VAVESFKRGYGARERRLGKDRAQGDTRGGGGGACDCRAFSRRSARRHYRRWLSDGGCFRGTVWANEGPHHLPCISGRRSGSARLGCYSRFFSDFAYVAAAKLQPYSGADQAASMLGARVSAAGHVVLPL